MPVGSNDIPLVLREVGEEAKDAPLTNAEVDNNFINLKTGILTVSGELTDLTSDVRAIEDSNPWTPANDGPGSGLNADLLDGKQLSEIQSDILASVGTDFLPINGGTITGNLTINAQNPSILLNDTTDSGVDLAIGVIGDDFYVYEPEDSTSTQAPGDIGRQWIKITDDKSGVGNMFLFADNKVWHEGNDGPGSGLNADTLDGLQATDFYTRLQADTRYVNLAGSTLTGRIVLAPGADGGFAFPANPFGGTDDLVKFTLESGGGDPDVQGPSGFGDRMRVRLTVAGEDAESDYNDKFEFIVPDVNSVLINDNVVLNAGNFQSLIGNVWSSTNQGPDSGLDADTLDGLQGSEYVTVAGLGDALSAVLDEDLTAIAGLTETSGFLKKTSENTWELVTSIPVSLDNGQITSATLTTTSIEQVSVINFSATAYRSAKYFVQASSDSSHHITEVSVVHDGTTVYMNEYGTIMTGSSLFTIDSDISNGNLRLLITPASTTSTTTKVIAQAINV